MLIIYFFIFSFSFPFSPFVAFLLFIYPGSLFTFFLSPTEMALLCFFSQPGAFYLFIFVPLRFGFVCSFIVLFFSFLLGLNLFIVFEMTSSFLQPPCFYAAHLERS